MGRPRKTPMAALMKAEILMLIDELINKTTGEESAEWISAYNRWAIQ